MAASSIAGRVHRGHCRRSTRQSGYVEFSNAMALVSPGDNVIVSLYSVRARLNDAGQIVAVLPATDDPDWQPSG
ncbi:hypothetical protein GCM10023170_092290 [Phytohabitans houttuyneae]